MEPWVVGIITAINICAGLFLLIFLFRIFLRLPGKVRKETAAFVQIPYAHRGLHDDVLPENSMPAFEKAIDAGYGIECDIQISKDGIPMVFHDGTLKRMCGEEIKGGICDYTYEELMNFRLKNSNEKIPRFDDFLKLVDGCVPLLIELKNDGDGKKTTEKALELLKDYDGPFCIESFNPFLIRQVRKARPDIVRGVLAAQFTKEKNQRNFMYFGLEHLWLNFLAKPDFIAFKVSDAEKSRAFRYCKTMGAYTFAWTIRTEEDAALADKIGFDIQIFENIRPKVTKKSL